MRARLFGEAATLASSGQWRLCLGNSPPPRPSSTPPPTLRSLSTLLGLLLRQLWRGVAWRGVRDFSISRDVRRWRRCRHCCKSRATCGSQAGHRHIH
ncbi:hypothetical protein ACLKA6_009168 [Drosophila palustris]